MNEQSENYMKVIADVAKKKREHDDTCVYRGRATEVHFNPADMTRLGIDEDEDIFGLLAKADQKLSLGRMRIYCDIELGGSPPARAVGTSTFTGQRTKTPANAPVVI